MDIAAVDVDGMLATQWTSFNVIGQPADFGRTEPMRPHKEFSCNRGQPAAVMAAGDIE
jgi:hypothetical protein